MGDGGVGAIEVGLGASVNFLKYWFAGLQASGFGLRASGFGISGQGLIRGGTDASPVMPAQARWAVWEVSKAELAHAFLLT